MTINLGRSQVKNLIEFFDSKFIDHICDDTTIDSIEYICDMCEIYRILQNALRSSDNEISNDKHTA